MKREKNLAVNNLIKLIQNHFIVNEIDKNFSGGKFASYQQTIHLPKNFIPYFEGYDMPLQSYS